MSARLTAAILLAFALWIGFFSVIPHYRDRELAAQYAYVLAHCANGGSFAVGDDRLVTCVSVEVWKID